MLHGLTDGILEKRFDLTDERSSLVIFVDELAKVRSDTMNMEESEVER